MKKMLLLIPYMLLWFLPAGVVAQKDTLHLQEVRVVGRYRAVQLPATDRLVTVLSDTLLRRMPGRSLQ